MLYDYKLVNLNLLVNQKDDDVKSFLKYNGVHKFDSNDIKSLLKLMRGLKIDNKNDFNVGYEVDRLGKEFDLVKVDDSLIINIELKTSKMVISQCEDNYEIFKTFYPDFQILIFMYTSSDNKIFVFDSEKGKLVETNFYNVNNELSKITNPKLLDINIKVLSAYMYPQTFFEKKYILSNSQKESKRKVINNTKNKTNIIAGRAGTGKTLLALDLFNYYCIKNKTVYLAPFKINNNIATELIEKLNISTVKQFVENKERFDVCIVDEAQRISEEDIKNINELIDKKIILLGDLNQDINGESCFQKLYDDKTENLVTTMNQPIRSDDTFDLYARKILDIPKGAVKHKKTDKSKIKILMKEDFLRKKLDDFVYLELGKSYYFESCTEQCVSKDCFELKKKCQTYLNTYSVMGNEYDNIVIYFCDGFTIVNNKLKTIKKVNYGKISSELYCLITRAKESLMIVTSDIKLYNFLIRKLYEMKE
ncbi:MAG TPA: AAA family ATPase [Gallicola sp.]|nr:AAA family ATPase [Gallicola sp.]